MMDGNEEGREQLFIVYEKLVDDNKEKIVKLAEGLLNSQKIMKDGDIGHNGVKSIKKKVNRE